MKSRRAFLGTALAFAACGARGEERPLAERDRAEDFDALWQAIDAGYAYFGTQRHEWSRTRDRWRPRALAAGTREQLAHVFQAALAELRDDHVALSGALAPRRIPAETDVWPQWHGEIALLEAVRTFGEADVAGLRPGQVIRSMGGMPVASAVHEVLGEAGAVMPGARDWALRRALAGPRRGTVRVEIAEARGPRVYDVARVDNPPAPVSAIVVRRIGEHRDLGYIRLKVPLSDPALPGHFEIALRSSADARGLILDLRETTGPFAPAADARAGLLSILGAFIAEPVAWQARESRTGERVVDIVKPRALRRPAQLAVLVDRWTAAEGEALAVALQSAAGARLIGTRMAGLRGELRDLRLPRSGLGLRFPAERTFRPDGTPREAVIPDVAVDLAAPKGGPGDPILYQGLKLLGG